jgi:aryl-alcohol dehydrogenase-like predicted oxidoreductase
MMSYGSQAERAWHLDEAAAEPIVKAAVEGGVTFFDTSVRRRLSSGTERLSCWLW